jgi:hypothetical protein
MKELTQQEKEQIDFYAKLANASYQKPQKRQSYNINYGLKDKGLIYDADASDKFHAVYINPTDKKVYVSIRGTQLKHGYGEAITDLLTDAQLAFGGIEGTKRFKASDKKINDLKAKYPDMNIETYGHSLGGTVGSHLSKKYGIVSHNFNTGSGVLDPKVVFEGKFKQFDPNYKENTHYYHTGDFDVLSETSLVRPGTHHIYDKKENVGSHALTNFYLASEEK